MQEARHQLTLALVAFSVLSWSSLAEAKRQFPSDVKQDVPLSYLVPCSVCHSKGNTGSATANTPFALSLRARGLTGDSRSLKAALAQLATDHVDSDGDGTSDVAELVAQTDPNSSANGSLFGEQEPGYGCGGTAPTGTDRTPVGAALGVGLLLLRRRRDRARGRS